jgi:hypothetical protein
MASLQISGGASTVVSGNTGGIISPAYQKMTLANNYLDIQSNGWAQQYLPELYEQEVDRYGNRTISGFLSMLSAEMPLQSDQVIWSEQGRLHLAYEGVINPVTGTVSGIKNIDDNSVTEAHAVRKGATVVAVVNSVVFKAYVNQGIESSTADYSNGVKLDLLPYGAENVNDLSGIADTNGQAIKFFVYGSEFSKGSDTMAKSIEPKFQTFTNRPLIIKDHFEVNGSDTAQIGWIEVAGESGQGGYLWYLKSSGDTRQRFNDYMEMVMVEAEKVAKSSTATADSQLHDLSGSPLEGSEGLFSAIENRGIVATNLVDVASEMLDEFDSLLAELDKQGAIEENMLYLNRAANLEFDDMLAGLSVGANGGTAYGVFENSEDMALNLGFTGFRRGSYDFYKTDWKYLNDSSTRGLVGGIKGVIIPAGTSSVYDQQVGSNVRRPFLHVRYRAGAADDRKLKSWVTGSVGGPTSSNIDKMEINYLSERCLVVQAANNFVLLK